MSSTYTEKERDYVRTWRAIMRSCGIKDAQGISAEYILQAPIHRDLLGIDAVPLGNRGNRAWEFKGPWVVRSTEPEVITLRDGTTIIIGAMEKASMSGNKKTCVVTRKVKPLTRLRTNPEWLKAEAMP